MKYEDLKDLKPGDKVVIEVQQVDQHDPNLTVKVIDCDTLSGGWVPNYEILKVYHEPAKIKMTVEEKKEFDELLKRHPDAGLNDFLDAIWEYPEFYTNLHKSLFGNFTVFLDRKNQLGFARAWENPDLIEVIKPKKYYLHLFPGENGYLNKLRDTGDYEINDKDDRNNCCTAFTKEEIAQILQDTFKIVDKALEEVPEDE